MNIKEFIEAYNKTIKWNADILESLDSKLVKCNEHIWKFICERLSAEEITENGYDFDNAKICQWINGQPPLFELDIYRYKAPYGYVIYRVSPNESEEDYKKRMLEEISDDLEYSIKRLDDRIRPLKEEADSLKQLRSIIKNK